MQREYADAAIDTSFRNMSVESLTAMRLSAIKGIESIAGEGQAYSINGRQTTHAGIEKWVRILSNCDAALAFKSSVDAPFGNGFVSRFSDFSRDT